MSVVWLNGRLVESERARIDPADRGFTLGDGVFETLRAQEGIPLHDDLHFARLRLGCGVLQFDPGYDDRELRAALVGVLRANELQDAALRLTISRGVTARGVLPAGGIMPTVLITAGPLPAPPPQARLILAQCTRRNEFSPLSRIKSLNYLDSILARQEAARAGADDALLLNTQGRIAETTAANFFLYVAGRWITPPVTDGALPGIARLLLLQSGQVCEASIVRADLLHAEAAFLANSLGRRAVLAIEDVQYEEKNVRF